MKGKCITLDLRQAFLGWEDTVECGKARTKDAGGTSKRHGVKQKMHVVKSKLG